ncbi:hypothetical protein BD779DRAFT_1508177 [Infundibulicybe gibba]|nr:hypothetical protein BD779DRAFT_1508177 [Infundibulicybe gibba]
MSQSEQVEDIYNPRTFMPKEGHYSTSDYERIRQLFPIAHEAIPRCFVDPRSLPGYLPPKVYLGWYIPKHSEGVVNLGKEHFPEMIKFESGKIMSDGYIFDRLPICIRTHYQVPEKDHDQVDVVDVTMKPSLGGLGGLAVVVGNNHNGWLSQDLVERISDDLFDGQQPSWYLCPYEWGFLRL